MDDHTNEHFMLGFIQDAKKLVKDNDLKCSPKEILDLAIYLYEDCRRDMMASGPVECQCEEDYCEDEDMN